MSENLPIILASQSPARKELLKQIHIVPDQILPADIDETPLPKESPHILAMRLAHDKGAKIAQQISNGYIVSADTVATCSRHILPKAKSKEEIQYCLNMLSGRRHRLYTGLCIIKIHDGKIKQSATKLVTTTLKFKRLSTVEIEYYCQCDEGLNKAGGYSVQGFAASFVTMIQGSFSNIVGLPLTETKNMLISMGFKYPNIKYIELDKERGFHGRTF